MLVVTVVTKKTHHFFGFLGKQILLPDDDLPVPLSVLAAFKDVLALCAHSETQNVLLSGCLPSALNILVMGQERWLNV